MGETKFNLQFTNHDMRNYIGAAISYFQLLEIDYPELKGNKNIGYAVESLRQAISLSQDITNQHEDVKEADDSFPNLLTSPVKELITKYTKPSYKKYKKIYPIEINVSYTFLKEEKFAAINPVTVNRVRENIINNAIKAGATKLDAQYEMKKYCFVITFHDNGSGMTQDDIDKLMLKKHGDGIMHGIGTKSILSTVEEHGFFITYSSTKGHGTTIRILCPYRNV